MLLISDTRRAATALAVAQEVAARLGDPRVFAHEPGGRSGSLARGELGLVVLHAALDEITPGAGWDLAGNAILRRITRSAVFRVPGNAFHAAGGNQSSVSPDTSRAASGNSGLFSGGVAGLGAAAALLGRRAGRYRGLLGRLDAAAVPAGGHDLVSGAAGTGAYLLLRPPCPAAERVTRVLARGACGDPPFPWPREAVPDGWDVGDGYADCGLAHGAAGPLAVLSMLSARSGDTGARPAVERLAGWLLGQARQDAWGTTWPAGVAGDLAYPSPRRASWCYGVPGIARALWLAGDALDEPALRAAAGEAMTELLDAPDAWGLDSPGVCHGIAGLMLITAAFATEPGGGDRDGFTRAVEEMFDRLCGAYDARRPLGFATSDPGLLNGAAGIALALLSVTAGSAAPALFLAA